MDLGQKSMLVNMVNNQGWLIAKNMGEAILKQMDSIALECEDDSKVAGLVREARAARKFWDAFLLNIDNGKNPAEQFNEVSM